MNWESVESNLDESANFSHRTADGGMFECRYVYRAPLNDPDYIIAYISSHSGCNQACRFCHLTQTAQTMFRPASIEQMIEQAQRVLSHYWDSRQAVDRMNVNFMARGEPLLNEDLIANFGSFANEVMRLAVLNSINRVRFNISSIFPAAADGVDLVEAFAGYPVTLFWSLYSLDPAFRSKWMPKSGDPQAILDRVLAWQKATSEPVVIHHALIEGENDSDDDLIAIADFLRGSGLEARLNLVRYNPFDERLGREPSEARYERALSILGSVMSIPGSRVVSRVGFDVKASCGMFLGDSRRKSPPQKAVSDESRAETVGLLSDCAIY